MSEPRASGAVEVPDVLAGGGEMGALMRAMDWGKTPVGPPGTWPQSLRTAVSILLEARVPMYIAWGPAFVQLYNDGYRAILGPTKHPAAMGRGAPETFAESWAVMGPMFEGCGRERLSDRKTGGCPSIATAIPRRATSPSGTARSATKAAGLAAFS